MSRYYSIETIPKIGSSPWTSFPKGVNDPGALNVELDLLAAFYGIPQGDTGGATVTIHGVPLSDLQQANNFASTRNVKMVVRGGMQAGLPLAVPSQAGLLLEGQIFQTYGNWANTEMNLSFVLIPSGFTLGKQGNFVFNWMPGQSLADALNATLNVAYASFGYKINMNIGTAYATSAPITHIIPTLTKFAQFIHSLNGVRGVNIAINNGTILVTDGSIQKKAKQLLFTDLIGQPKWVEPNIMQFMTVMRADIQPGTLVTMPVGFFNSPGIIATTPSSAPSQQPQNKTAFQNNFLVQSIRHIGNFRDPDGTLWALVFQATPHT